MGGVLVLGGSKRDEDSEAQPWCGPERDNFQGPERETRQLMRQVTN